MGEIIYTLCILTSLACAGLLFSSYRRTRYRLLFWSGQSFETPGLEPEGTFKAAEARYTALEQINPNALASWLEQSRIVQWDYKNIVKRRGRLERLS